MSVYWCELAWLGDETGAVEHGAVLTIADDRIADVVSGVASPPPGAAALAGLTVPGFANAHSHAFQRALRGRTHGEGGTFWTWRDRMYELAARIEPDSYRMLARAVFAEMALAGFTCIGEFHYLHNGGDGRPYGEPNEMALAVRDAAADAGVRLTLLDTCYLNGGIGEPLDGAQLRFGDADAAAWGQRAGSLADTSTVRIGAAVHSVRSVDPASIALVAGWARDRGAPLHAHVSEQPAENEQCLEAYGCTPVELLATHGALGERFTAVHATHLTDRDVGMLAGSAAACCLCPTTERDLADGIGPSTTLQAAAIPICLGTDSHAMIDPFAEARAVELHERLASLRRGAHHPGELLRMATTAGYRSLGWPEGGRIEPGALADLTTVALDSPRLAGIEPDDAVAAIVFAASACDVRHVVVGGRVVVEDGAHRSIDVAGELTHSIREVWR